MKKLLWIVVLGLLLSGNVFAEIFNFNKCWDPKDYNSHKEHKAESDFDEWYFEIDLINKKVTRTMIRKDSFIKSQKKNYGKTYNKVSLDTYKIQSFTKRFIEVSKDDLKYVFDLKNEQLNLSTGSYSSTYNCQIIK